MKITIDVLYLVWVLVLRCLNLKYQRSFLGLFWVLAQPLVIIFCYWFLFGMVIKISSEKNYLVFLLSGIVPWLVLTQSVTCGVSSLVSNASNYSSLRLPLYVFPISDYLSEYSILIVLVPLIGAFFHFAGISIDWVVFSFNFGLMVIVTVFTSVGWVILLSVINVFIRDVQFIINIVLTCLFFSHPIVFPIESAPLIYRELIVFSPLYSLSKIWRSVFGFESPALSDFAVVIGFGLIGWGLAHIVLRRLDHLVRESV